MLLASRARAQMQYRTSFVTDILGTVGVGLAEFAEVWVIFHNVDVLGGLDFTAALLVFALSNLAFSIADMFVGHLDQLPRYIRAGQVDAFYVRPAAAADAAHDERPVAAPGGPPVGGARRPHRRAHHGRHRVVAGHRAAHRAHGRQRHARSSPPSSPQPAACSSSSSTAPSSPTPSPTAGQYAAQQSQQVFPDPLRIFWTFVIPTAFVAYLPAVAILDLPGDHLAPPWLAWFTPLAAALAWTLAGLCWRAGTRHYQGAGG